MWYYDDKTKCQDYLTLDSDYNKKTLTDFINNKSCSGSTPMGKALEKAYELVGKSTDANKYVLFMTDGIPGGYNKYIGGSIWNPKYAPDVEENSKVADKTVEMANKIKPQAVMYTVGFDVNNSSFEWKRNGNSSAETVTVAGFLNDIATSASGNKKYAYTADNVNELQGIFDDIAKKIGDLYSVQPEKIVDVIDSRFELTQKTITDLEKNSVLGQGETTTDQNGRISSIKWCDSKDKSKIIGQITIEYPNNGSTIITWTGAAAKIGNAEAEDPKDRGWHASLQVKAKDDFIGGNMIPTNGTASGIYLNGGGVKKFDQPSVNVRLLDLTIDSKNITVFKGDPISAQNFRSELAETLNIKQLDGKTKPLTIGENQEFEYTYPGSTDAVGKFICTYEAVKGNINEHTATEVGTAVEQYKLTVTYHPYSLDERKTKLSKTSVEEPTSEGGTVVGSDLTKEGTYKVNVIAGQIEITKKLSGNDKAQKDASFTFKIYKVKTENGSKVEEELVTSPEEITATIKKGENVAKFDNDTSVTIAGLSRGEYIVKETSYNGYTLESAVYNVETTNCLAVNNTTTKDVTFTIGTDTNNKNALEANELKAERVDYEDYKGPGCIGVSDFTNK